MRFPLSAVVTIGGLAWFAFWGLGCGGGDEEQAQEILARLSKCQHWVSLREDDAEDRARVVATLEDIRVNFTLREIRLAAAKLGADLKRESPQWNRVEEEFFVLNRYLFAVPQGYPRNKARFYGGFGFPTKGPGTFEPLWHEAWVDLMWPLSHREDATIALTGTASGWYVGPLHDPVAEFDYFFRRFGAREFP